MIRPKTIVFALEYGRPSPGANAARGRAALISMSVSGSTILCGSAHLMSSCGWMISAIPLEWFINIRLVIASPLRMRRVPTVDRVVEIEQSFADQLQRDQHRVG